MARQRESTGFHRSSRKKEDQHYRVSSTNSLSVIGSSTNFQDISAMQSSSPCTKTMGKVRLLQKSRDHSALHCRKNPCSWALKQIGTHHRWRPSTRDSVWVQSQQRHHRHGICPQIAPREIPVAEQRTLCSICWPDQSIWYSTQKGTVEDHGAPWLPSTKVPQHGYPTVQRPAQPS